MEILMYFILEVPGTVKEEKGYVPRIAKLVDGKLDIFKTDWNWGTNPDIARHCVLDKNKSLKVTEDQKRQFLEKLPDLIRKKVVC